MAGCFLLFIIVAPASYSFAMYFFDIIKLGKRDDMP